MSPQFSNAEIEWNDDNKPRSSLYGDIYFSIADACGEAEYVFLDKNNLKTRWSEYPESSFIIAECGFGSGLNFLSACKLWYETTHINNAQLHYIACEKHPLRKQDLTRLHAQWPHLKIFSEALLEYYPDHTEGIHRLHFNIGSKEITLDLLYGDANDTLSSLFQSREVKVDAWFLDGFSPKLNPNMWSLSLFQTIANLSKIGTTLSTYSVAGDTRRGLGKVGFEVRKEKGYGRKRHMLCATFATPEETIAAKDMQPHWFYLPNTRQHEHNSITIIGAGLAGCSSAYALAKKGWKVTLIEREEHIATMASANPQGIVHCKISKQLTPASQFIQQAYLYAIRHYKTLSQQYGFNWQQCGMLQLAYNEAEKEKQNQIITREIYSEQLLQKKTKNQSSALSNIPLNTGGLFFPESGWLNPQQLCQSYCQHPNIKILVHSEAIDLIPKNQQWQVRNNNRLLSQTDNILIANSIDANKLSFSSHYPLVPNRGQVDFYKASHKSQALKTVLCSNAYIIPAYENTHSIGGSFSPEFKDTKISSIEKKTNLSLLEKFLPDVYHEFSSQAPLGGRAAIRCSTSDYLPIVGPVESYQANKAIYKELSLNARRKIASMPQYEDGLFINVAHGSHGLTTTPLASQYIASLINNEPLPIQNEIVNCLHPIRFLIRELKKQN